MLKSALNEQNHKVYGNTYHSNGRQLAGIICLIMVLGIFLGSAWTVISWMQDANDKPLSRLIITGEYNYTTNDDIRQAVIGFGAPRTFIKQDVNVIHKRLERLPWIKRISVRKKWPDTLKIFLVEYVPVVRWNDLYRLEKDGTSFSEPTDHRQIKKKLPLLYGPEGSEKEVLEGYCTMNRILTTRKYILKIVAMSARHSWRLVLDNDTRLELGRSDCIGRLQRFIEIYPILQQQARVENKRVSYVDLRYESGASVGWAPLLMQSMPTGMQKNSN